jgi:hypothetical protein
MGGMVFWEDLVAFWIAAEVIPAQFSDAASRAPGSGCWVHANSQVLCKELFEHWIIESVSNNNIGVLILTKVQENDLIGAPDYCLIFAIPHQPTDELVNPYSFDSNLYDSYNAAIWQQQIARFVVLWRIKEKSRFWSFTRLRGRHWSNHSQHDHYRRDSAEHCSCLIISSFVMNIRISFLVLVNNGIMSQNVFYCYCV